MVSYSKLRDLVNQSSGFSTANHISVTKVEQDYVEGELLVGPDSLNPHGFVHGGCLATLADTVAGTAACTRGARCVTVSSTMSYLAPAAGEKIRCVARAQKVGRTLSVFETTLTDEGERTVATGIFTFYAKETPTEK